MDAPQLKVGDRWVYRGKDGYRVPILWEETREITAIGPQGITVRVTGKGTTGDYQRTETWSAPGVVTTGAVYDYETDRFDPALIRYKYPMATGESGRRTSAISTRRPIRSDRSSVMSPSAVMNR